MNLRVQIDGQQKFNGAFDTLAEGLSDLRPVWPEIEQQFFRATLEQFNSLGSRGGSQWQPLSPRYREWKERKFPGKPILVLSGRLKRSLSVIGGDDQIREAEPLSLTLGTKTPYAVYHQRGTNKMPARPPLELTRDDYGKFISRIFRYAERVAQQAGFDVKGSAE